MKWFQVDSDTPNDPRVRAVIKAFDSPEGFGGLVLLWCHIADHGVKPGRSLETNGKPMRVEELIDASGLDPAKFLKLVTLCVDLGHFERGPWESKQEIVIPAMRRRADTYTKRGLRRKNKHSSNTGRRVFANKTVQDNTVQKIKNSPPAADGLIDTNVALVTKFAHEVIEQIGLTNSADVAEGVKSLCAQRRVAYNSRVVRQAIDSATVQRQHGEAAHGFGRSEGGPR